MTTQFDDWLRQLAVAKQGPVSINIDRGHPFEWSFALAGDWTGAAIASSLRLYPDAAGSTVEDFTASGPVVETTDTGDFTAFTLSLSASETAGLTPPNPGEALVQLAYDVLFTPSGGIEQRIFGGCATISGKVTDGS